MNAITSILAERSAADGAALVMAVTSVNNSGPELTRLKRGLQDHGVLVQDWPLTDVSAGKRLPPDTDVLLVRAGTLDARSSALIQRIAGQPSPFVFVLPETDDIVGRIVALELGADDVLRPDSDPREIVARARSLLRRAAQRRQDKAPENAPRPAGTWVLNYGTRQLHSPTGTVCSLSKSNIDLIDALSYDASCAVSGDKKRANKMRMSISRLRSRFRHVSEEELPIRNVWGLGYVFDAPLLRISERR